MKVKDAGRELLGEKKTEEGGTVNFKYSKQTHSTYTDPAWHIVIHLGIYIY